MLSNFAIANLGATELIIILAIVLLLFGGKKLPELSRSLGQSIKEIRNGVNGELHNEKQTAKIQAKEESAS